MEEPAYHLVNKLVPVTQGWVGEWRNGTTHCVLGPPISLTINRNAQRIVWLGQVLSWGSLFPGDSRSVSSLQQKVTMTEDSGGRTPNPEFKSCTLTLAQLLQMKLFFATDREALKKRPGECWRAYYLWIRDMISVVKNSKCWITC